MQPIAAHSDAPEDSNIQKNFSGSNTDSLFTAAISNSFPSPLERNPIAADIIIVFGIILVDFLFYPPTERFGGYSDEPGVRPSSVRPSQRPSVNIFVSAQ